jgi:DNA-binding IclR family transcriptional regulator
MAKPVKSEITEIEVGAPRVAASRYQVPNLDRALTVMELLSDHPEGLNTTEISSRLRVPKNSVFRITRTLFERGYLHRDESNKAFRLTPKFFHLGHSSSGEQSLIERSLEAMRELRDQTMETVLIGTLLGTEGVVLEQVIGKHPFKFMVDPGLRFYLHTAAPGKAILARLPEAEAERIVGAMKMPRFTERTITRVEGFQRELRRVREDGYAVDCSEEFEGQHCVAAAIVNAYRYPIAAIWITAPSTRLPESRFEEFGRLTAASAARISERFGHRVLGVA